MEPIRVLLVDEQQLMREGLRVLLEMEPGLEVVGEAGDGEADLAAYAEQHPDVVVRHHQGCKRPMRLENKLPDPVLQLGAVSGSWRFPQINNPSRWENRANSLFASATLPVPFALGHGSRLWGSAVIGTEPAINPVPLFLEGGWITQGVIRQRPFDSVVLGLTRSSFSPSLGRA